MPEEHAQDMPICGDCDGFPTVAITTGNNADGSRATLTVTCPACKGTGHTVTRGPAHAKGAA
ncbi:hypothetical protein OG350_15605 [Streptomyces achromogenes]|uniref:Molecular chaperone DnaJ n=1 Tax=Streptomyces achromogenes TaxID=67255 RepID=A0ABZ1KM53_STRAH